MTEVDAFSLTTVPVEQLANGTPMNNATAFVWKHGAQHYLITNWHVVTGKNAYTNKQETPAAPDSLRCLFNVRVGDFGKQQWDIRIRDDNHNPLWLIRPSMARSVDVVAIPIPMTGNEPVMNMYPINALLSKPLKTKIGMDVFILGYPFGSAPPAFPVWKRGSIASEPDLVRMTTGHYLVDTASRPGMSGAPVILRDWTNNYVEGSMRAFNDQPATNFLGVYSGRMRAASDEAQIGLVWHASFIEEIIVGNKRDE
ncbi:serine protease [Bradyrhizobium sp. WYCCWR 13023]|uniref:Serine protease n=1 Tax=Bradyrhizobium zhengyangense TaxID=2911009 RepID=A0A9X1R8D7_9BRAD|nr:serine protease [Bradyrhizobium zhengyangense]MCG2625615.1 serine protease [Bradyrhizobium zhengyangense]